MNRMERVPTNRIAGGPTLRCTRCGFTVCDGSSTHDCNGILEKKRRREYLQELAVSAPQSASFNQAAIMAELRAIRELLEELSPQSGKDIR